MIKVAIIDSTGKLIATGEWNGKVHETFYVKLEGHKDFYNLAYMYKFEDADEIMLRLDNINTEFKRAQSKRDYEIYAVLNEFQKFRRNL